VLSFASLLEAKEVFMRSARITPTALPLSEPLANQMAKLIPPGMPPPQLFLSVARNAGLFEFMVSSGLIGPTGLMDRRTLPKDVRETLILRTCVATGNDYEFNLHVQTISERMGLSMAQIDDIRLDDISSSLWREDLRILIRVVDSLVKTLKLQNSLYAEANQHFSEEDLIEITQLVGLYTGVAMMVGLIRPELDRYHPKSVFTTKAI
jgi:4-carboxymuconolactone decarboxylase